MASYIYTKVQEAIGGKATSSGFQKNWSPNKIRALYIMRDFILVVDYLQGPKMYPLSPAEVGEDLQNPHRVGSLNNLLSSRQLSCLEEIYADEVFARFPNVLDLQGYADSVINSASRLRYYSYTSGINGEELRKKYHDAFLYGNIDFTYAKDIGGIRYVDTGNTDWYKKYNLRPQYYGPDADGGKLSIWFKKVERDVAKYAEESARQSAKNSVNAYIMERVYADLSKQRELHMLKNLISTGMKSEYALHNGVAKICSEARSCKSIAGLTRNLVVDAAQATGIKEQSFVIGIKGLSQYYGNVGLYDPDKEFNLEKLEKDNLYKKEYGFLQIGNVLDTALAKVYEKYIGSNSYKYTVIMGIQCAFPMGVPSGKLARRLEGKVKCLESDPNEHIDEYLTALYSICGISKGV